jgi:hypothetical protein
MIADLFGATLDGVVTGSDADVAKCQTAVHGALEKIVDAKLKNFLKCKKTGLKADIISRLGLDQCLVAVGTAADDAASKIGKAIAKLASSREKSCTGVAIASAFPGDCSALGNTTAFDDCADRIAECRACRIIVAVDGPFMNCDVFDDGVGNGSCPLD